MIGGRRPGRTSQEATASDAAKIYQAGGNLEFHYHYHGGEEAGPQEVPGRPLEEVTDPFALEVHRPIELDDETGQEMPALPAYVRRDHDAQLAAVVRRAAAGASVMATLVGGSSTGKTRACWEALAPLRQAGGWSLWHPYDPTRPEAALAEAARVAPRTVVWLNETQFYLHTRDDTGPHLAAALRTLLNDPRAAPVLVLGTLWPQHWDTLTRHDGTGPDPHAAARTLLTGTDIAVPAAFTGQALQDLQRAAAGDPRLAQAAALAEDGQVTQHLAGAPNCWPATGTHPRPPKR